MRVLLGVSGLGGVALLLVMALWIVPSVLIARYAEQKGQSYVLFLLIGLFETEEDLKTGHETLNSMDPPGAGMGNRTSVDMYEVGVDIRV